MQNTIAQIAKNNMQHFIEEQQALQNKMNELRSKMDLEQSLFNQLQLMGFEQKLNALGLEIKIVRITNNGYVDVSLKVNGFTKVKPVEFKGYTKTGESANGKMRRLRATKFEQLMVKTFNDEIEKVNANDYCFETNARRDDQFTHILFTFRIK